MMGDEKGDKEEVSDRGREYDIKFAAGWRRREDRRTHFIEQQRNI